MGIIPVALRPYEPRKLTGLCHGEPSQESEFLGLRRDEGHDSDLVFPDESRDHYLQRKLDADVLTDWAGWYHSW